MNSKLWPSLNCHDFSNLKAPHFFRKYIKSNDIAALDLYDLMFTTLGKDVVDRYEEAAKEYLEGARLLVEYTKNHRAVKVIVSEKRIDLDNTSLVLYPAVYLCQHSVELTIKGRLLELGATDNELRTIGHDILNAWRQLRPKLDAMKPNASDKVVIKYINDYIMGFHKLAPTSEPFRYPPTNSNVPKEQEKIWVNLQSLYFHTEKVIDLIRTVEIPHANLEQ